MRKQVVIKLHQTPRLVAYFLNRPGLTLKIQEAEKEARGYFVPKGLSPSILNDYKHAMDWIERYARTLSKNAKLRHLTDEITSYAQLIDIEIEVSKECLVPVIFQLNSIGSSYFTNLSASLAKAINYQEQIKDFKKSIDKLIPQSFPADRNNVVLVKYSPLNELEIVSEIIFSQAATNSQTIIDEFDKLTYKQKSALLKDLLRTGNLTSKINYQFEIIAVPKEINRLISVGAVTNHSPQSPTPAFGYDVEDESIDDTTVEMLVRCFDMSYKLYASLQTSKQSDLAQLAVLGGHRQRSLIEINAKELVMLGLSLKDEQTVVTRKIIEQIGQRHPLISSHYLSA